MASTAPNIPQNQNCSSSDPPPTQGWDYNSQKPLRECNQGLQEQFGIPGTTPHPAVEMMVWGGQNSFRTPRNRGCYSTSPQKCVQAPGLCNCLNSGCSQACLRISLPLYLCSLGDPVQPQGFQ